MLEEIKGAREEKLKLLEEKGINPYPARTGRNFSLAEVRRRFFCLSLFRKRMILAGRIIGLRDMGALIFFDLNDGTGSLQLVARKKDFKDFGFDKKFLDIGDFIEATGRLFRTRKGEKSLRIKGLRLLAKSLRPLPSAWYGLEDTEERFRRRYLDALLNPEVKSLLTRRSKIIRDLREEFWRAGFIEVETPILQPIPGGAQARPFVTRHNALEQDFFLRIAPELYLKRLLVGGFNRVFEIGRVFRNEGIDRFHNPEFTSLECYWAYQDYRGMLSFIKKVLKKFIPKKWGETTFLELFRQETGKNFYDLAPLVADEIFKKQIRPKLI